MWVESYFIPCSLLWGEIREPITEPLCVLEDVGIHTSHVWVTFNGPVLNYCPMGPARQTPRPRGLQLLWSESILVFSVECICQSKMEMGHYLSINPVVSPSSTGNSVLHLPLLGTTLLGHCHEHIRPYTCKQTFSAEGLELFLLLNIWTYTYKLLNTLFQNYSLSYLISQKPLISPRLSDFSLSRLPEWNSAML